MNALDLDQLKSAYESVMAEQPSAIRVMALASLAGRIPALIDEIQHLNMALDDIISSSADQYANDEHEMIYCLQAIARSRGRLVTGG